MIKTLIFSLFFSISGFSQQTEIKIKNLSCEYKENPLGIETNSPRLSWQLISKSRNQVQSAYRIIVSNNPDGFKSGEKKFWDSGKKLSDQSIQIEYKGLPLKSAKKYYWKVMIWDGNGHPTLWSPVAFWQMGLLTSKDWGNAKWIGLEKINESDKIFPALHLPHLWKDRKDTVTINKNLLPQFRKEINIRGKIKSATAFICGLGHFDFFLNGEKVSDNFLDPGWTKYEKYAQYVPFDLSGLLHSGKNVVGIMLGNGFYNIPRERYNKIVQRFGYPAVISKIQIEYEDGSIENIVTDKTWRVTKSPITFSSIYGGEDYDARLVEANWKKTGFNDSHWQVPLEVSGSPVLFAQHQQPLKIFEAKTPLKISSPKEGVWVYDMGQNMSAIPYIMVAGNQGAQVKISPSELLGRNGLISQMNVGEHVFFIYTIGDGKVETWRPQFTYYGFRYIQIEGAVPEGKPNPNNLPVIKELKSLHVRGDVKRIGEFTCSNELFNKIFTLIDWGIRSNTVSVSTDCPQREKLGWVEQAYLMGNSIRYNYDVATLFTKIMEDIAASQQTNGLIPAIAPEYVKFGGGFRDSPEWGSVGVIVPYELYKWNGDKRMLENYYNLMKKYVDYLSGKAVNHIISKSLGDWADIFEPGDADYEQSATSTEIPAMATYYYDLIILKDVARLLGKTADEKKYHALSLEVKQAFNSTFFKKDKMTYDKGSQTANAMAIYFDLVEPEYREKVLASLVGDIKTRNYALTSGDIGWRYVIQVLHKEGMSDILFKMNNRSDVPGYGYQMAQGATALTESWKGLGASNNHLMFGQIMEWFYGGLAGIGQTQGSLAFKEIIIKPEPVGDITEVKGSSISPYGLIKSYWKISGDKFDLHITIPPNTRATVFLPSLKDSAILEGGKKVKSVKGIIFQKWENGRCLYQIGSGTYHFTSKITVDKKYP